MLALAGCARCGILPQIVHALDPTWAAQDHDHDHAQRGAVDPSEPLARMALSPAPQLQLSASQLLELLTAPQWQLAPTPTPTGVMGPGAGAGYGAAEGQHDEDEQLVTLLQVRTHTHMQTCSHTHVYVYKQSACRAPGGRAGAAGAGALRSSPSRPS